MPKSPSLNLPHHTCTPFCIRACTHAHGESCPHSLSHHHLLCQHACRPTYPHVTRKHACSSSHTHAHNHHLSPHARDHNRDFLSPCTQAHKHGHDHPTSCSKVCTVHSIIYIFILSGPVAKQTGCDRLQLVFCICLSHRNCNRTDRATPWTSNCGSVQIGCGPVQLPVFLTGCNWTLEH